MPLVSRKRRYFEVPLQDVVLRISGPGELYEEARAAGMQFWEVIQSYGIRDPAFRTSSRPVEVADAAPAIVQEMASQARAAGVGPMFALQGALLDAVGGEVRRRAGEVVVSCDGDHFVVTRKRARLAVDVGGDAGGGLAVVVKPELGPQGIHTTAGRGHLPGRGGEGVVVIARSCILADAAAAGATIILSRSGSLRKALRYLKTIDGVHGALVIRDEGIGVAGALELAA